MSPVPILSWRRAAWALAAFGGIGLTLALGAGVLGGPATARRWLSFAWGPWALPAAIACFAALAFLGVPQIVLIAAAVAAFGPWRGMTYSWIGTMISALLGFAIGRLWGARWSLPVGDGPGARMMSLVARNGFLASLVIRLVPFAPFVVINIAAGVAAVSWLDFAAGAAIGILPKIAVTGLAGKSIARAATGEMGWAVIGVLVLAGALWFVASLAASRWMKP